MHVVWLAAFNFHTNLLIDIKKNHVKDFTPRDSRNSNSITEIELIKHRNQVQRGLRAIFRRKVEIARNHAICKSRIIKRKDFNFFWNAQVNPFRMR